MCGCSIEDRDLLSQMTPATTAKLTPVERTALEDMVQARGMQYGELTIRLIVKDGRVERARVAVECDELFQRGNRKTVG